MMLRRLYPLAARGASLLEILIAMSLLAAALSTAMTGQLAMLRIEKAAALREQAALIAASAADAMRERDAMFHVPVYWRLQASTLLPDGDLTIETLGDGLGAALVSWTAPSVAFDTGIAAANGCSSAAAQPGRACIAALFVE